MDLYTQAIQALNARQTSHHILQRNRADSKRTTPHRGLGPFLEKCNIQDRIDEFNVIHIAGTKGKGSTSSFVDAILNDCRKRCGKLKKIALFTSPHMTEVRERIKINSQPLEKELFAKYYFEVATMIASPSHPTYFRFLALLFLYICVHEKVDVAICEVGVGGTYDATNVFKAPSVTVITSLGFDHVKTLGNTIDEIACHKAGIMKRGSPCFTVPQRYEAASRTLIAKAKELDIALEVVDSIPEFLDLPGFQKQNAALAIRTASHYLEGCGSTCGRNLVSDHGRLSAVLREAQPLGRAQILRTDLLRFFIDGAHTAESLECAVDWYCSVTSDREPRALLFAHESSRDSEKLLLCVFEALRDRNALPEYVLFCSERAQENDTIPDLTHINQGVKPTETTHKAFWTALAGEFASFVETRTSVEGALQSLYAHPNASRLQILATGSLKLGGNINFLCRPT